VNIFFRTNFSNKIGIGHTIRCNRLALELSKNNHNCYFFFDKPNSLKFINFRSFNLNTKLSDFNELKDAQNFCEITRKIGTGYVVVDDYRIGYKWEKFVSKFHKKVITFDDLNDKEHYSDYLINYNPKNFPNVKYNFKFNKKKSSEFLIHPKYNIISREKIIKNYNFEDKKFYVTFYIGGGGDLTFISKIIMNLVKNGKLNRNIKFLVILGVFSENKEKIKILSRKYKSVSFYDKGDNLYYIIKKTNLFVGTSGTAIFETAYLKTPTILFKKSVNQDTNIFSLENLGHFMFLDINKMRMIEKISNLIVLLIKNYKRFKKLNNNPIVKIDNNGSTRIMKRIFSKKHHINKNIDNNKYPSNKILKIQKVTDKDINHYLHCRNLNLNRKTSSHNKKIDLLDHYIWWFNTKRNSYILIENGKKILYFYDEEILAIHKKKYFLSGWFACDKDCTIKHILFVLNWQRHLKKNVLWISFVNKNNQLAIKYSKYVGWKILDKKNKIIPSIKRKFNLDTNNFVFYERES